jgi:hypothetical protein
VAVKKGKGWNLRGNEVLARITQAQQRHKLRRLATGGGHRSYAAFKRGHALL